MGETISPRYVVSLLRIDQQATKPGADRSQIVRRVGVAYVDRGLSLPFRLRECAFEDGSRWLSLPVLYGGDYGGEILPYVHCSQMVVDETGVMGVGHENQREPSRQISD